MPELLIMLWYCVVALLLGSSYAADLFANPATCSPHCSLVPKAMSRNTVEFTGISSWFSTTLFVLSCLMFSQGLADSELVLPNPSDENVSTNVNENILLHPKENQVATDEIIKTENIENKIPALSPNDPTLSDASVVEQNPQAPITPAAELSENDNAEAVPIPPLNVPEIPNVPEPAIPEIPNVPEPVLPEIPNVPEPVLPEIPNVPEPVILENTEATSIPVVGTSDPVVTEPLGSEDTENLNDLNSICKKRNTYYKVDGSCDAYVECREFKAQEQLCPDGLHYNPESKWPEYPCGYPMDVSCQGRGAEQQSTPTEDCPHQYGFYPPLTTDPNDCSPYRMCVGGKSIDMQCPFGLAFNPEISRCDWPGNVNTCNSEVFLGFKCPPHPVNSRGQPLDIVINYKFEKDCHKFFSCHGGLARLLSCDLGFVFDAANGRCADSDIVPCHSDQPEPPQ